MRKFLIFIKNTLMAIGVISSFVTVLWAIFPTYLNQKVGEYPWVCLIVFISMSVLFGWFKIRKKRTIELSLSTKVIAKVYYGDIFEKKDIIVIPVNEYFDTKVDDRIISSRTIHGMFIRQFFGGDEENLRDQIAQSLSDKKYLDINHDRNSFHKKRYPLGTVAQVVKDDKVFFLVALSKFNNNHRAEVSNSDYQRVICDLFIYINQFSQGKKVHLPLIGSGHSGVSLSKQKLLEFLLFAISMNDNLTLINGVDIVLHSSIQNEINLSITEVLFNCIEG
ncbi:hypothetical protein VCSRO54_2501 [Vibrio cholerae]|uniref:macro domain-containing protein n=1 Tax=Vibrio cholerae TaxID=666 RepID=UPI0011D8B982|nr:macro domain-containing protein [Vibrio cholerae]TXZ49819.1 hypothetical protein FXE24_18840 [Vibrio cholerae]GHW13217.1 hypothetical protein VCSRO54_2501 [Vibrio cholerae]